MPIPWARTRRAAERAKSAQKAAVAPLTERPGLVVAVDDHGRAHAEHHAEVGEGQIHDVQVGGRPQRLGRREDVHDQPVTQHRQRAQYRHGQHQNFMPQRIQRRPLVPAITNEPIDGRDNRYNNLRVRVLFENGRAATAIFENKPNQN